MPDSAGKVGLCRPDTRCFVFISAVLLAAFVGYKIGNTTASFDVKESSGTTRIPHVNLAALSRTPQWKFDVNQYNKETQRGIWDFMDQDDNERSRHAIVGSVYIRNHAPPNGTVLDIGCATGTLSDFIIPTQIYEGYDLGCEAIKKGITKRPTVNLTCADAATLIPRRALYDVIVFNEMLYFMDVKATIERYLPFLRPKTGFIMISLFKFLHLNNGKNEELKLDFARENITAIAHAMLKPVNKIEIVGNTFDGKASWQVEMLRA